ncbi:MAG: glycosyltransferase family 2 protein [Acetatifactor sp.]
MMSEDLLVSIITVAYNSEKTIAKTIEAVFNQTYPNIEYIIIDGASTDGTMDVAKSYQERFDAKDGRTLIIISEPDKGMYDALNKGAKLASGVLVGQTNADDYYELDAVESMVNLYMEKHYDVAWGSINVIKPSGNTVKHAKIGSIWTTSGWCHPAMFSKREILLETPYICESMYDDFDFITSVHRKGKKIVTTDKVISNFSFGGMSTKKDLGEVKKRVDILYKVYRRHGMSRLYYLQRWAVELAKYILG